MKYLVLITLFLLLSCGSKWSYLTGQRIELENGETLWVTSCEWNQCKLVNTNLKHRWIDGHVVDKMVKNQKGKK